MFLAEAGVHADRREDARRIIADMEALALITPCPLLAVQLLYARAVLADDDEAEQRTARAWRPTSPAGPGSEPASSSRTEPGCAGSDASPSPASRCARR